MMSKGAVKITFRNGGQHKGFIAFSSGNGTPWLAVFAMNSVVGGFQKLGSVSVERTDNDSCTLSAVQWSSCVLIPLNGRVEVADV